MSDTVLIVGASDKPERYAYKAFKLLEQRGYKTILLNPRVKIIDGHKCYTEIRQLPAIIDTITLYLRPELLAPMAADLLSIGPRRIIFNPGTEDAKIAQIFRSHEILVVEACTLVMLKTNQF